MTIHITHHKCPSCKYEYKDEFTDQSPVGTKILKGGEPFIYLHGTFHYSNGHLPTNTVRLLACPKCFVTHLEPNYRNRGN